MKAIALLIVIATPFSLTGCETIMSNLPGVYSIDIQQGNMIDQTMIDQLRPNMTKRQVLYIMGSPMLADNFHEKRWDYLYSDQPGGESRTQKRVSLYFNGDNLVGVQGDFRPSAQSIVKESTESMVDVPKRDLDTTMWEKISSLLSDTPATAEISTPQSQDGATPSAESNDKP